MLRSPTRAYCVSGGNSNLSSRRTRAVRSPLCRWLMLLPVRPPTEAGLRPASAGESKSPGRSPGSFCLRGLEALDLLEFALDRLVLGGGLAGPLGTGTVRPGPVRGSVARLAG